jgi:hypothetical protein
VSLLRSASRSRSSGSFKESADNFRRRRAGTGMQNVFILMLVGVKSTLGLCKIVNDYSLDCAHAFIFSLIALVA